MDALNRMWGGQASLGAAFWLYYVAGNVLCALAALIVGAMVMAVLPQGAGATVPGLVLQLLTFAYLVASSVGVWRSAGRHAGSQFLAWLARAIVLLYPIFVALALLVSVVFVLGLSATPSIIGWLFSGTR